MEYINDQRPNLSSPKVKNEFIGGLDSCSFCLNLKNGNKCGLFGINVWHPIITICSEYKLVRKERNQTMEQIIRQISHPNTVSKLDDTSYTTGQNCDKIRRVNNNGECWIAIWKKSKLIAEIKESVCNIYY